MTEKPLTIGGVTFKSFEDFAEDVKRRQLPKGEVIKRVKQRLATFENTYGMTSKAFYRTIAGTPAEDEPHYLEWKIEYESYLRLTREEE